MAEALQYTEPAVKQGNTKVWHLDAMWHGLKWVIEVDTLDVGQIAASARYAKESWREHVDTKMKNVRSDWLEICEGWVLMGSFQSP